MHLVYFIMASVSEADPHSNAELGQVKTEVPAAQTYQQPVYPVQPQQPYPQQPYPPQQQQYPQ